MFFLYLQAHATDVASLNSELSSLHSARDCLWEEVQRLAGVVEGLEGELLESKRSLERKGWELTGAQRAVREAGVKLTQQVGGILLVFIGGREGGGVREDRRISRLIWCKMRNLCREGLGAEGISQRLRCPS